VRELNLYFQWRAFCESRILIILNNSPLFDKKVPTDLHLSALLSVYRRSVGWYGQIIFLLIHAIQALALRRTLEGTTLVLWLDQSNALKANRASVGDEEGQLEIKVGLSQRNSHSANLLHSFGIIN